jgi:hypothetical protein
MDQTSPGELFKKGNTGYWVDKGPSILDLNVEEGK